MDGVEGEGRPPRCLEGIHSREVRSRVQAGACSWQMVDVEECLMEGLAEARGGGTN